MKLRSGRRTRSAAALAGLAVLATLVVAVGPADAGAGDKILNPGSVTFTVDAGGFLNLGGNAINLPATTTETQCQDGTNNDVAVDDETKQQDLNIDFDGGASSGVVPPTAVDAQCNSGGGALTQALDDSETKAGHQSRAYLTLTGTVAADGTVTIPKAGIVFPRFYVFSSQANGVIDVIPAATGDGSGTIDPLTGQVPIDIDWQLEILQAFLKINCIAPVSMSLSTDASDAVNGGPLTVTPQGYDRDTGAFTITGNTFTAGAMTPNPTPPFTPPTAAAGCTTVGSGFGLPAASGSNAAELGVRSSTVFQTGLAPRIAGRVENTGGDRLEGITVTLMNQHPAWTVAATDFTDASGEFAFDNIPAGTYQVRFFDGSGTYERTWHGGTTYKTAAPISIGEGGAIHFTEALADAPTGSISGQAKLGSGAGAPGVKVNIYTKTDGFYAQTTTGAGGYYNVNGVPDGDYYVWFNGGGYVSQWYKFKLLFFKADLVTVAGGQAYASGLLG